MDKKIFLYLHKFMQKNKQLQSVVIFIESAAPNCVIVIYYSLALYLILKLNQKVIPFLILPLFILFIVTNIRKKINRPRPFDELNITPLTCHKSGNSFPSRHAASSCAITMAVLYINIPLGIITGLFSFAVCLSRILAGIHYPSDVMAGALIGAISGYLVYFILLK